MFWLRVVRVQPPQYTADKKENKSMLQNTPEYRCRLRVAYVGTPRSAPLFSCHVPRFCTYLVDTTAAKSTEVLPGYLLSMA